MKQIWKFEITPDGQTVQMPVNAVILSVQNQKEKLCLWAFVDPRAPTEAREFEVIGTGHAFQDDPRRRYLGTVQMHNGFLVWHVFEICK